MKTLFIGNYFDGDGNNYLIFVADENCDRDKEFLKAHEVEYGDAKFDLADLEGVYPVRQAFDYGKKKEYKIELTETN